MTTPVLGTTSAFRGVGVTITALAWPGKGAERVNIDHKVAQCFMCIHT